MSYYIIDIINFILLFLLMDFFNGIHNNYLGKKLKSSVFSVMLLFVFSFIICFLASFWMVSKIVLLVLESAAIIAVIGCRVKIKKNITYEDVEEGKEDFFGNQKIMVLVPHEDDDINLMGGVIEEYIKHGSEVYVVFSTNGDGDERFDMSQMGYTRINEAIKVLTFLGVPEKNIIFLGYGDGWDKNGTHIYNAPEDKVIASRAGRTATYGTVSHPAYHDNNAYTLNNCLDDIQQLLMEYRPDTIFCIDYDTHNDHRALSMMFERVMGQLIKTTDYQPTVYKGYGYRTAWNAPNDFFEFENNMSTVENNSETEVALYKWESRIRLPVDIKSITRDLYSSKLYKALCLYETQKAIDCADRIVNGDKVFWERRTDSLLYNANISVSSGDKDKLTDYMLLDCNDLIRNGNYPYDGVWHPEDNDPNKSIRIDFNEATYIDHIVLYDSPSPDDNVLNAIVEFEDGTSLSTGKLESYGTRVCVNRSIKSIVIRIDKFEGNKYGLTEIEAFAKDSKERMMFKIIDNDANFVYDYIVNLKGKHSFGIYNNINQSVNAEDYKIKCNNKRCQVKTCGKQIIVNCPAGQKCLLSLVSKDGKVLDTVLIRNPRKVERFLFDYCKDKNIHKSYAHRIYRKMNKVN